LHETARKSPSIPDPNQFWRSGPNSAKQEADDVRRECEYFWINFCATFPAWLRQNVREGEPSQTYWGSYKESAMTTMTRFVPFRSPLEGVAVLQNRLNSIFNDFASSNGELQNESLGAGNFIPPVDIYEDANRLVLRLEVPGIPQEDLQINLENQTLTVKGERRLAKDEKEENFHRIERRYGSFVRSFTLPATIETDSAQANYENGVLSIALQKKEAAKPKQLKIEIGSGNSSKPAPKQMEASRVA